MQCAECNEQAADKKALDRHMRSAHKVAYNCDFCGAKLASEKSLVRHKKKHSEGLRGTAAAAGQGNKSVSGTTANSFAYGRKCRICGEKFPTDEDRKEHYDLAHPGEKVRLAG